MTPNEQAFLDTIGCRYAEGTIEIPDSENGYKALVGGSTFESYADHPRIRVWLPRPSIWSTAAGRYQILAKNFDAYSKLLALPDFSPSSQDQIALRLIKERHALDDINAGNFASAVQKCNNIWASFPGAGYGQHEAKMEQLQQAYLDAGGTLG